MRVIIGLIACLTLIAPPVPVAARSVRVYVCGAPSVRFSIPVKAPPEGGHDGCKKGCHAANERKKRVAAPTDEVGEDENCC